MPPASATPTESAHSTAESARWFERAQRVTPGGVNSPVRAMRSVGREHPLFVASGQGARITDIDGNSFVDWVLSWGALPFGHADSEIVAAVRDAAGDGSSFGAPTTREVELAELICDAVPCAEQVRFTSSGTEATMSALRVARAATGREAIICFSGNYHGHADPFLATGGSGLATLSIPASPGVPTATAELTLQATYGDLMSVEQLAAQSDANGRPIAAIFVEPVAANMGVVEPPEGFLAGLRALCDRIGALLVFDEVITGFRVAWGGAQERYDVTPDLATFGKIIGGGLPVGAFVGRRELLEQVAPAGQVYQAGTLSGNPLAMAAGLAQLRALRDRDAYALLELRGEQLATALTTAATEAGAPFAVSRVGSLVTLFHLNEAGGIPRNFTDAQARLDTEAFGRTHAGALARGHYLPASQFEALFASTAHDEAMIEQLGAAVRESLVAARG